MNGSDFDLDYQNRNLESKIVASLERISQAFRVLLWQQSKDFSLTPIQVQLLIFLLHHRAQKRKVGYLAREFNMTKATISETIKTLEQKELIKKESELTDTRSYIIHLTTKGRKIANKISLFTDQIRTPVGQLKEEDKKNLFLSLIGIINHLNQSGVITIQRMCMTCSFYQSSDNGRKHFCKLLNQNLKATELRVDCPEHEPNIQHQEQL